MPFDFPNSPTVGQQVTASNGVVYTWNGTVWTTAGGGGGGAQISVSDTPPASPANGALWFDSANAMLMIYENDGNSSQWVVANNQNVSPTVTVADASPASPRQGQLWYDSVGLNLFLNYNDGNSSQWVIANNQNILPDAPTTGALYGRQSGAWVQAAPAAALNAVGRNLIHNSQMAVQQRAAGPWTATSYTADRWLLGISLDTATGSVQSLTDADRAAIGDETAQYALQVAFTGSVSAGAFNQISQRMENTRRFGNKQFTASFWARATSGTPKIGVAMTQVFGTGGSPSANVSTVLGSTSALSATWTRYSFTVTLPSVSGKAFGTTAGTDFTNLALLYSEQANTTGIGVQSGTIQVFGVQLEYGSVATQLEKLEYADDLRHCQRFYQTTQFDINPYSSAGAGCTTFSNLPVVMRTIPTATTTGTTASNCSGQSITCWTPAIVNFGIVITAAGAGRWYGTYQLTADL